MRGLVAGAALATLLAAPAAFAGETAKDGQGKGAEKAPEGKGADKAAPSKDSAGGADAGDPRVKEREADKRRAEKDTRFADPYAVEERDGLTYRFVGVNYRAHVVPKFLVQAFVRQGGGLTSHEVGISYEARRDGMSVIPSLAYQEYGTSEDILFLEKGKPERVAGNWSVINSSLKAVNAQVDVLWSTKIDKGVDFEYGLGVGLGVVFDKLMINWVYEDPNGKYKSSFNDQRFSLCEREATPANPGPVGCGKADHSNADVAKVGKYNEPSWFQGGYKPVILPILTPEFGIRVKPSKEVATRVTVGWGLTGPWFGVSGAYGFAPSKKKARPADADVYEQ